MRCRAVQNRLGRGVAEAVVVGVGTSPVVAAEVGQPAVAITESIFDLRSGRFVGFIYDGFRHGQRLFIHDIVYASADLDGVITRIQDISLLLVHVVGGQVPKRECDRHGLALARGKQIGLCISGELDGGFFDAARLIRRGEIDFHDILA
ncbi:hypothetical protein SDC9_120401 [bioreactor metagenome]|uniref:Uncharacterized protein n=1 Tax=bioreactor metagenome TaxID=1076179 RepID=A0A645C866_9ZZZZ